MEYTFYTHTDEGYLLKAPQGIIYAIIIVMIFAFLGIMGIWFGFKAKENHSGFLWGFFFLGLAVWVFFRAKGIKICFQPEKKQILVKGLGKIKTYPFSEFLNFQKTSVRTHGITTQWHVSAYMNENGENKKIVLGIVGSQKTADKLIDETTTLLNMGRENNNVLSRNRNTWS
jgi:hypothetical protein